MGMKVRMDVAHEVADPGTPLVPEFTATVHQIQTIASILQARPNTPTARLAELMAIPPAEVQLIRERLESRGISFLDEMDPHGLEWTSTVPGPTEGDIGRARLRQMLSAVQKGAIVYAAKLLQSAINGQGTLSAKDVASLLTSVSNQLRLERGEPTAIAGESLAVQGNSEATRALIDRLSRQREEVLSGRQIPGVS